MSDSEEYGDQEYSGSPQMACIDARLDELEEFAKTAAEGGGSGGGGGSYVLAGPLEIDRTKFSGQDLFDGVKIGTLVPGVVLADVSWRTPAFFSGWTPSNPTYPFDSIPAITYIGTPEINFLQMAYGWGGWNIDTAVDIKADFLCVGCDDSDEQVGDWQLPWGRVCRSLKSVAQETGSHMSWNDGAWIPDTSPLDLIVKVKQLNLGDNAAPATVDTSTAGLLQLLVHLLVPVAAPAPT